MIDWEKKEKGRENNYWLSFLEGLREQFEKRTGSRRGYSHGRTGRLTRNVCTWKERRGDLSLSTKGLVPRGEVRGKKHASREEELSLLGSKRSRIAGRIMKRWRNTSKTMREKNNGGNREN